ILELILLALENPEAVPGHKHRPTPFRNSGARTRGANARRRPAFAAGALRSIRPDPYGRTQPPSSWTVVPVTQSFRMAKTIPSATSSAVPARGIRFFAVIFL